MEETTAARYRRLCAAFADRIRRVAPDSWANPSPCEDWTALDLVGHVVDTQGMFEKLVGRDLERGPPFPTTYSAPSPPPPSTYKTTWTIP